MNTSARLLLTAALSASLAVACSVSTDVSDAPDDEAEHLGQTSQALCPRGVDCLPPRLGRQLVGGGNVLAPVEPQAGPSFECLPPEWHVFEGQCYEGTPGGPYPTTLYACPLAYPVQHCNWKGQCTCWSF